MRFLAVLAFFLPFAALADDVPPPPKDCPRGSLGDSSHGGPYCEPTTCASDKECQAGFVCQEQALCIETETYTGGRSSTTRTREVASGVCEGGKTCASPATCETKKRCVSPSSSSSSGGSSKGWRSFFGCGVSQEAPEPVGILLLALSLACLLVTRWKR